MVRKARIADPQSKDDLRCACGKSAVLVVEGEQTIRGVPVPCFMAFAYCRSTRKLVGVVANHPDSVKPDLEYYQYEIQLGPLQLVAMHRPHNYIWSVWFGPDGVEHGYRLRPGCRVHKNDAEKVVRVMRSGNRAATRPRESGEGWS